MDPTSRDRMDELWRRHGSPDRWVLCTKGLRHGDLFIALCLLGHFVDTHGGGHPLRLLTTAASQSAVAAMFPGLFEAVILAPELDGVPAEDLLHWTHETRRDRFAPGSLLLLQPWSLAHQPLELNAFVNEWQVSYTGLLAAALRIPLSSAPNPPAVAEEARRDAARIADRAGLVAGAGLVLFPYAQSFRADHLVHLAKVATRARAAGWRVVTSCVPGQEEPVPGTDPVDLPFQTVRPFCELAGRAISVRSGISDMLAQADCRHVVLYDRAGIRDVWGLCSLGLGGGARELVLPAEDTAPGTAADGIWSALTGDDHDAHDCAPPPDARALLHLSPMTAPLPAHPVVQPIGRRARHARSRHLMHHPGLVLAEGWSIEDWGAWTIGHRAALYLLLAERGGMAGRATDLRVSLRGHAALSEAFPVLAGRARIGGEVHGFSLRYGEPAAINFPLRLRPGRPALVELLIEDPQSPFILSHGASADTRRLGFAFTEMVVLTGTSARGGIF